MRSDSLPNRGDPNVRPLWQAGLFGILVAWAATRAADPPATAWILKGGTIVDGTGAPGRKADLLIRGQKIAAIGEVRPEPGARVVDISGLVVAPGFIDLHSHSDSTIL